MTSSRCEEHSLTTEIPLSISTDTPHRVYSSVDMSTRMSDGEDNIADDDSAYGEDSLIGDDTITLSTYITDYRYEYGRRYHSYRDGAYWGPNDDIANEQQDLAHHMYCLTLDGKLHLAPISNPQEILDVGTGTGIWATDMADEYPSAKVTGVDLSPIQPPFVPPNCVFEIDDVTLPWTYAENQFDFIHVVGKQFEFEDQRDGIVPPLEEKKVIDEVYTDNDAASEEIVKDWDDKEEGKLRRKIDIILIPILALAFFGLQIDRGNISAALTSTITEDLGVTTNQINIGTQLLSAGIVITEIPSNIILQRIGPQVWLSAQLIAWGLVGTFQAFVQSYPAYLATRLLLGLLEGGFIPGALYYLSTWYKRPETSFRTTLFFYGQMFAGATSSLISAGLLKLDGKCGLAGWRWIFLVEGLITIFAAILFILFIPKKAGDGSPLISMGRWSYFSPREKRIILDRVLLDDPLKTREHIKITGRDIWKTVTQTTTLQHMLITLVAMSGFQGLNTYTPSMIKSFGFSAVRANALASVPVYASIVWTTILAYSSDKIGHRGPFVLLCITWNVISYACLRTSPTDASSWHRYSVIACANVAYCSMHVLNVGWLSFYCKTPQERSISMALIVMSANLSGISGAQIFRSSDAPLYIHGLTAICALAAASWVQTLVLNLQYLFRRKKTQAGTV